MLAKTRDAVGAALGAPVRSLRPLAGGDVNEAYEVVLGDGRAVFVKTNADADPGMFPAEARGLRWLSEARALRVPEVLAVSTGEPGRAAFLALEMLPPGRAGAAHDELLGRGLAALHRAGAPGFGLDHDNFIGPLPQTNAASPDGASFWAERRLLPMLRMARDAGALGHAAVGAVERVVSRLPELIGPHEPAARLHGDLWGGNVHTDVDGAPVLIDPAVYGGHREVDLAMMRLFGGFSERVFHAYAESHPLGAGHRERVPLWQLYPLLVHARLFGASYAAGVERAARSLA